MSKFINLLFVFTLSPLVVFAQDALIASTQVATNTFALNNLWIMIAGCMVFIMHLGFASIETGLTSAKSTMSILLKNTMIVCLGTLTYALVGFNLMYPGEFNGFVSFQSVLNFITVSDPEAFLTSAYNPGYTWYTDFFFQAMFAATAATIISGAVAGRIKMTGFLVFCGLFLLFAYPIVGSWKWGGGFLDKLGFYDFAGSTIVHSVGGWAALVLATMIGPRLGKYDEDGSVNVIKGSNMPLAVIGVFLLWFGWFGFNGGSVLSADPAAVSLVLVTTALAAAAGGFAAGTVAKLVENKSNLTMTLNGILAGLVGITAGADQMAIWEAVVIGSIAGVLVYFAARLLDEKIKVDDPVGAVSVHLVCGIWGTLAVGIFGNLASLQQLYLQLQGVLAVGIFTVVFSIIVGLSIKAIFGLRADKSQLEVGDDIFEHHDSAYPEFTAADKAAIVKAAAIFKD
jgi:Amt family ammonium transporter